MSFYCGDWFPFLFLSLLQSLLDEPNPNSPANSQAAQLYQENKREYEKRVSAIVEQSWRDSWPCTPANKRLFVCLFFFLQIWALCGFPVSGIYLFISPCPTRYDFKFLCTLPYSLCRTAPESLFSSFFFTHIYINLLALKCSPSPLLNHRMLFTRSYPSAGFWVALQYKNIMDTDIKCYFTRFPSLPKFSAKGKGIHSLFVFFLYRNCVIMIHGLVVLLLQIPFFQEILAPCVPPPPNDGLTDTDLRVATCLHQLQIKSQFSAICTPKPSWALLHAWMLVSPNPISYSCLRRHLSEFLYSFCTGCPCQDGFFFFFPALVNKNK